MTLTLGRKHHAGFEHDAKIPFIEGCARLTPDHRTEYRSVLLKRLRHSSRCAVNDAGGHVVENVQAGQCTEMRGQDVLGQLVAVLLQKLLVGDEAYLRREVPGGQR